MKGDTGDLIESIPYDPSPRGGDAPDGRKLIPSLDLGSRKEAEFRMYDRLFQRSSEEGDEGFLTALNPDSLPLRLVCGTFRQTEQVTASSSSASAISPRIKTRGS